MNKKILLSTFLMTLSFTLLQAQEKLRDSTTTQQAMNSWYVELGGQSFIGMTLNYERFLSRKPGGFSVHAGIGGAYLFLSGEDSFGYLALPVGISYNLPLGKENKDFVEFGGNFVKLASLGVLNGTISWRHQSRPKGLQTRVTLIPLFYLTGEKQAAGPWFGFSIGKRF